MRRKKPRRAGALTAHAACLLRFCVDEEESNEERGNRPHIPAADTKGQLQNSRGAQSIQSAPVLRPPPTTGAFRSALAANASRSKENGGKENGPSLPKLKVHVSPGSWRVTVEPHGGQTHLVKYGREELSAPHERGSMDSDTRYI